MPKILNIKEPYFTAGRQYIWPGKSIGLGIKSKLLEGDGELKLKVGDSPVIWKIDKQKAREFVEKYQSYHFAKNTKLSVIDWHEFEKEPLKLKKGEVEVGGQGYFF